MHKHTQRSLVDHQPSYERTKLSRCQDVHLEHANRMRTNRFVPHAVDAQFWELMADAGPQLAGKGPLGFVFPWLVRMGGVGRPVMLEKKVLPYLEEVNMYIKACGQQSIYSTGKEDFLSYEPPVFPFSMGLTNFS